eukprot:TRINITY_DN28184_c0_g1_i1.p1 TRINITY_DN28184_c0_g1~~TRINITY_DN28184_c0_g1_i1.p1  ORF type:complete len:1219 (-),score=373.79 TRINITY_DN28184_c0_g1_i1:93-3749(-)
MPRMTETGLSLFQGTPRSLCSLTYTDIPSLKQQLQPVIGSSVVYSVNTFSEMEPSIPYIAENDIVSQSSIIPGMARKHKSESLSSSVKLREYFPSPLVITPFFPPEFEEQTRLTVGNILVDFPTQLDADIINNLNRNRKLELGLDDSDNGTVRIVRRQIMIGVHNGRTFIRPPVCGLLKSQKEGWVYDGSISFNGYVPSPLFSLVFEVQIVVSFPLSVSAQQQYKQPSVIERAIPVGWWPFILESPDFPSGHRFVRIPSEFGPCRSLFSGELLYRSALLESQNETIIVELEVSDNRVQEDYTDNQGYSVYRSEDIPVVRTANFDEMGDEEELQFSRSAKQQSSMGRSSSTKKKTAWGDNTQTDTDMLALPQSKSQYPTIPSSIPARRSHATTMLTRAGAIDLGVPESTDGSGFPAVKDDMGNSPLELGRPGNVPSSFASSYIPERYDMVRENNDHRRGNDIHIIFMGLTRIDSHSGSQIPKDLRSVFFTFQFWRYPHTTTEPVFLELTSRKSKTSKLAGSVNNNASANLGPFSGDQFAFRREGGGAGIDCKFFGQGEYFSKYLCNHSIQIDMWDSDSLMLLGSTSVDLKSLLRQGKPAVQLTDCYDLVFTEKIFPEEQDGMSSSLESVRGVLHLRIANVGIVTDRIDNFGMTSAPLVSTQQRQGSRVVIESVNAQKLADKNPELAAALQSLKLDQSSFAESKNTSSEIDPETRMQKKLSKIQQIKKKMGKESEIPSGDEKTERERELRVIQMFRDKTKPVTVTEKLRQYTTSTHSIYPSFGSPSFFEYAFSNPYNQEHLFELHVDDNDLVVVRDAEEWRELKKMFNATSTPTEENLISQDNKILLHPLETVYIPFKYQSFRCGQLIPEWFAHESQTYRENPLGVIAPEDSIVQHDIHISFSNARNVSISMLVVKVEPQPFSIDHTFRFSHTENDLFKQTIRIVPRPDPSNPSSTKDAKYIRCSSENVIYGNHNRQSYRDPQEIFFKYRCPSAPEIGRFYLLLFNDPYCNSLFETWQIFVHSLIRHDISGTVGEATKSSLILRGTSTSRVVKCFSSRPDVLKITPNSAITLVSGAPNEIPLRYFPMKQCKSEVIVHIVDSEFRELVASFLINATSTKPLITRAFVVQILSERSKNKKITYTNPYPCNKTFKLITNDPSILSFRTPDIFSLPPGCSESIGLCLTAPTPARSAPADVLVFINDAETEKTLDTFAIRVEFEN